jgi:hypothetical protein
MKNSAFILAMVLITASASGQPTRRVAKIGSANTTDKTGNSSTDIHNPALKQHSGAKQRQHDAGYLSPETSDRTCDVERNAETGLAALHTNRKFRGGREVRHHYPVPPRTREYRRIHTPFPAPASFSFYWTPEVRFEYLRLYPYIGYYKYPVGYRFENVSVYDAFHYRGEIANVYGKVYEVFYARNTDEYILYFGAYFPYHDFSVVIPGTVARSYSHWPEFYFSREYLIVTGPITMYEGVPEIVVRNETQIHPY